MYPSLRRKLKAAKDKLRQLQDLVAFVQQSPEAGQALPEGLGDALEEARSQVVLVCSASCLWCVL